MTRERQFAFIELARSEILAWAEARSMPLHQVEFVVPFVETDFSLDVWLFYERNAQLADNEENGTSRLLTEKMLDALQGVGYDMNWLSKINFHFDSHENVEKNFEGSYFYRLR